MRFILIIITLFCAGNICFAESVPKVVFFGEEEEEGKRIIKYLQKLEVLEPFFVTQDEAQKRDSGFILKQLTEIETEIKDDSVLYIELFAMWVAKYILNSRQVHCDNEPELWKKAKQIVKKASNWKTKTHSSIRCQLVLMHALLYSTRNEPEELEVLRKNGQKNVERYLGKLQFLYDEQKKMENV
ncbi:MAG: hypothetical protein Q4C70_02500 [Planctomycetia bacterium]|nr:hypothetical protein [Planctomycetia bacterium]